MDNFDLRKYLAEGTIYKNLQENENNLLNLIKSNTDIILQNLGAINLKDIEEDIESSGSDIRAITTLESGEKYEIYFRKSEEVDEDFLNDEGSKPKFLKISNQTIGYIMNPIDSFTPKPPKERSNQNSQKLLQLANQNKSEIEKQLDTTLTSFFIDGEGDVASEDIEGFTGYSFRLINDTDEDFKSDGELEPNEIYVGDWVVAVIDYNI